jgi:CRISPR system Cascade subunit CasB
LSDRKWDVELVEELTDLADTESPNRAALAHLRRGLDRPLAYTLGRVGWLFRRVPDFALADAVLAAGLFAWTKGECRHQRPNADSEAKQKDGPNFGIAFGSGLTLEQKQQREKRFIDLLDTDREELPYKLRQAITLIARDGVRLDWVLLIRHLRHWEDADRRVQKKWARGFWATPQTETNVNKVQAVSE